VAAAVYNKDISNVGCMAYKDISKAGCMAYKDISKAGCITYGEGRRERSEAHRGMD